MVSRQRPDYDVTAIGAGFAGLGLIHYLRQAGLSIRVFDKADDIGGTWTPKTSVPAIRTMAAG